MEERIEDYIKRIESIIKTLSEHIEFEDYDEDVLKEASEDKEAIENLLKRYKEMEEENIKLEGNKIGYQLALKECIPISVIQNTLKEIDNRNYNDYTNNQDGNEVKNNILKDIQELLEEGGSKCKKNGEQ